MDGVGREVQAPTAARRGPPVRRRAPPPSRRCPCTARPRDPQAQSGRVAALRGQRTQPGVGRHPAADHQVSTPFAGRRPPPCGSARRRPPPGTTRRRRRPAPARRPPRGPRPSAPPRSSGRRRRSRLVLVPVLSAGESDRGRVRRRCAALSMGGPPGNGSPSTLATLSNASPAASSMVAPSGTTSAPGRARAAATSGRRRRAARSPAPAAGRAQAGRRRRARPGGSRRTAACRRRARTPWPRRPRPAALRPGPGPAVTAIASTSASRTPAVASARSTVGHHGLQVRPAGHLGHDAAEPGVLVDAGGHRVGQQVVPAHEPHAGLVARGLDAQHQRRCHGVPSPRAASPPTSSPRADGLTTGPASSRRITRASVPDG